MASSEKVAEQSSRIRPGPLAARIFVQEGSRSEDRDPYPLVMIGPFATLALTLPLAACTPPEDPVAAAASAAERAPALPGPRDALASLFAAANAEPAGVVPLLVGASAALPGLDPREARLLADTLEPYCRRAFFTPERLPGMERLGLTVHVVSSGEVPERIARAYGTSAGILPYLNEGYDERRLRVGQELKVLDLGSDRVEIEVERGAYRLAAWKPLAGGGRVLVMHVPVGVGAPQSPTPLGRTTVTKRVRHPSWTDPETNEQYAPDDPRNVLGGYWMALDPAGLGRSGIGFHGFTGEAAANWIEQPASHGCVRMLQGDIDRLFHLAVEGTPVEIRP